MKTFKTALHFWIAVVSMVSFAAGWVMLAHSPKPAQPQHPTVVNVAPLPTLPPIQFFDNSGRNDTNLNFVVPAPQATSNFSILRTGGS